MFPPGNVDLAYEHGIQMDLRAAGGAPPYRWMIDGMPALDRAIWAPPGPGFVHLTVADSKGRSASEDIRLVAEQETP